ncbi:TPA: VWA domain-containing protein [Providencia stuartii]|uniref:VWA domain-containing protein n=3 Tax=Providencia stuartii TaxID=588 RepID=A0AAJ1JDS7_PROST|nr:MULTISPECIES: VWA domain-containing protein [Providencia]SST03542.1 tellurium resistance protein [Acinetobacter baumannii]AFH93293.1 von Willebrand factor A [Providencia stuartii MRSN 2154]AIN63946.1 von Willebrand factor type A domain protein [Providencia stuartii]AMG68322.1 VWA domain-containing protein [Providencia stuartii]APG51293.1 tellerium resistance protein TerY [Providencia stuartii]
MRRLPVYLLLDTSGSMHGEPIEAVKNGVQTLLSTLRQDPYALETAHVSIITFNSTAQQIVPLTDLINFSLPDLQASGTTALGDALSVVAHCIENEVQRTTVESKGDWRPLVFIMTDGAPTDDWKAGLNKFKAARTGLVIACAAGQSAQTKVLKEITEVVLQLDTADSTTIKSFFKWVSASISVGSQKVDLSKKDIADLNDLPPPPPEVNVVL